MKRKTKRPHPANVNKPEISSDVCLEKKLLSLFFTGCVKVKQELEDNAILSEKYSLCPGRTPNENMCMCSFNAYLVGIQSKYP